jgi:3-phenylpropionate/trans-cinnamate dioxygenase ferredoxin reductase subunit
MAKQVVIAGAGHAAGQVVASLKQKKYDGRIVLIGDEPWLPYQRPPLSKKFLAGELPAERLYFKPPAFYEDVDIDVRLNEKVVAIDRENRAVSTDGGDVIAYTDLVLAVGSRVRRVDTKGSTLAGIHYLRGIGDVDLIRADLDAAQNVVIVGAGYIGLEVAAVARQLGNDVTVLEMAARVMSRVVSPEVSAFFEEQHAAHGVHLLLSTGLGSIVGNGRVAAVITDAGRELPADVVVIGVGIVPNTELAEVAGLEVDNGIVVDSGCRTADEHIYAVGDCTLHPNAIYERNVRLESVHNALEQAKTAAANICGEDIEYSQVPWFWSDQYDLKLQIAGLSDGYDEVVVRGNPENASFSCMYLREGRLIACDAINAPRDFMQSKALIAKRCIPDKALLADADVQLKDLAEGVA